MGDMYEENDSEKGLTKEIPTIFEKNNKVKFPSGYVNNVKWWGNIS